MPIEIKGLFSRFGGFRPLKTYPDQKCHWRGENHENFFVRFVLLHCLFSSQIFLQFYPPPPHFSLHCLNFTAQPSVWPGSSSML